MFIHKISFYIIKTVDLKRFHSDAFVALFSRFPMLLQPMKRFLQDPYLLLIPPEGVILTDVDREAENTEEQTLNTASCLMIL